jgi:GT2 family glycosyltransferase
MVSAACVSALGGLDPYLFLYWEDVDFCRRARFHGWRVTLATKALARHFGSGTALTAAGKTRRNHMVTRNYFVTTLANPARGFAHNGLRCLRLLGVLLKQGLRGEGPAALFVLKIFLRLLPEWHVIYTKWLRDRQGIRPPQVSVGFEDIVPVISRAEHQKRADDMPGCGST